MARIEGSKMHFKEKTVAFPTKISEVITFEKVHVIITEPSRPPTNDNVWGVSLDGEINWQIPKPQSVYEESPYVAIRKRDSKSFYAHNWDGTRLTFVIRGTEIELVDSIWIK